MGQEVNDLSEGIRCQCPTDTMSSIVSDSWYELEELKAKNHRSNECPGDYQLRLYKRVEDGTARTLMLCSACCLLGIDEPVVVLDVQ